MDTQPGHCLDGNAFLVAEETINSTLDFATIILTVAVVRKLQTRQFIKTKLALIFTVGGLSGVIGFIKIGIVYQAANTNGRMWKSCHYAVWKTNQELRVEENDTNAFWDILQMATSIFCACAPMFRTIIPLHGVWIRLKSTVASWASESRLHRSITDSKIYGQNKRHGHVRVDSNNAPRKPVNWLGFTHNTDAEYSNSTADAVDMHLLIQNPTGSKTTQTRTAVGIV